MADIASELALLTNGVGGVAVARDVIRASGPDAVEFLQGQLSQDVKACPVGASARSLLLQPQGKVDAWIRIYREADDSVLIDVDAGWGEHVITRLSRFKLRTACEFETLETWSMIALRGAGAAQVVVPETAVGVDATWGDLEGLDLLGESLALPEGVAPISAVTLEAARIMAALPHMGSELTEATIPAEAAVVDQSTSFTKGCYVGQELVARVDSRGSNTPRKLRRVTIDVAVEIPTDAVLTIEGEEAGRVTSSVVVDENNTVALAYVKRAFEPPARASIVAAGGDELALADIII